MTNNKKSQDQLMDLVNIIQTSMDKGEFVKAGALIDNFPGKYNLKALYNGLALGLTTRYLDAEKDSKHYSDKKTQAFAKELIQGYVTKAQSYDKKD